MDTQTPTQHVHHVALPQLTGRVVTGVVTVSTVLLALFGGAGL